MIDNSNFKVNKKINIFIYIYIYIYNIFKWQNKKQSLFARRKEKIEAEPKKKLFVVYSFDYY